MYVAVGQRKLGRLYLFARLWHNAAHGKEKTSIGKISKKIP